MPLFTGFTWCGANEIASHPKTPTLEKAVSCRKCPHPGSTNPEVPGSTQTADDEDFTTRSRLAGLKQMSVASLASLKQRFRA